MCIRDKSVDEGNGDEPVENIVDECIGDKPVEKFIKDKSRAKSQALAQQEPWKALWGQSPWRWRLLVAVRTISASP